MQVKTTAPKQYDPFHAALMTLANIACTGIAYVRILERSTPEKQSKLAVCVGSLGHFGVCVLTCYLYIVVLQPMREDPPPDTRCRDKFLVQSVQVPADKDLPAV